MFPGPSPGRRPGWSPEAAGNGRPRGMAITRGRGNPTAPYRTRLIGRLALICGNRERRMASRGAGPLLFAIRPLLLARRQPSFNPNEA
jgi:hypothetical protein